MCGCRAPRAEVRTDPKRFLEHVLQLLVCCVTAQCLQANAPLHTYIILSTVPQLLAYRRREHDSGPQLAGLQPPLRRLILHMIQLEPGGWRMWTHSLCCPEDLLPAAPAASCPSSQGRRAQARMQNVVSCVGTLSCVGTKHATLLAEHSCSHAVAAAGRRLAAAEYLQHYGPQLFPPYFGRLLHPFLGRLATLEPDARVAAIEAEFGRLAAVSAPKDVPL